MDTILRTARLDLRPLVSGDLDAMYEVFADAYARRFYGRMDDRAEVAAWIAWCRRGYLEKDAGLWAVLRRDTGELIGDCGPIWQQIDGAPRLEIGWHIAAAHRRQGFATEAGRGVMAWCWDNREVDRLISLVHVDNEASAVVAARVHSQVTGVTDFKGLPHRIYWTPRPV